MKTFQVQYFLNDVNSFIRVGTKCAKCFNKLSLPRNKLRIWIFLNDVTDVEDLNLDGHDDEVEITFSSSSEWRGHPKTN